MKRPVFTGAAVAIITPMNTDGSVNYDELGHIIDDQIAHSTDAIVICGTTGESPTLTDEEHTECIRYTVKKTAGRVPVIAGTGSNDTKYAIWLSQQAEADGADALLLVTPYYNKTSQAGLLAHYTAIADAVHIPCILYNVPSRTGCNLTPATLAELAKHPNINAVKEASGNISRELVHAAQGGAAYQGTVCRRQPHPGQVGHEPPWLECRRLPSAAHCALRRSAGTAGDCHAGVRPAEIISQPTHCHAAGRLFAFARLLHERNNNT